MSDYESLKVFSGNSNKELSDKIAKKLVYQSEKLLLEDLVMGKYK